MANVVRNITGEGGGATSSVSLSSVGVGGSFGPGSSSTGEAGEERKEGKEVTDPSQEVDYLFV
jgi:hypothetical protein